MYSIKSRLFGVSVTLWGMILSVLAGYLVCWTLTNLTSQHRAFNNLSTFRKISQGMTKEQVLSLMGAPASSAENDHYEEWRYPAKMTNKSTGKSRTERLEVTVAFGMSRRVTSVYPAELAEETWPDGIPAPGMTQVQVLGLAGHPVSSEKSKTEVLWSYHYANDSSRYISFDKAGRVVHTGTSKITIAD